LHLKLPPGYHAHFDPEFLVLGRTDGSVVARFSGRGLVAEEVERAAWEDYGDAGGGLSQSLDPSVRRRPPAPRPGSVAWPPRPPS
jgi:hypothetical protein